jgi:hypothetical protein
MPDNTMMPHSRRQSVAVEALTPLAVPPKAAAAMLGFGVTNFYKLLNAGEIASFSQGGSRRVLVSSIHDYVARRIEAAEKSVRSGPGRPKKLPKITP